ncbi:MAG: peptidoglycan D,D-transpeptidase FtsI family protein [Gaiellales bacterium]
MNHLPNSRLRLIMILSVVGFALVIGRAIKIQTIDARELVRRADAQQRHVYDIPVPRGTITDRNGNQLAQQVTWKTLMAYPKQVVDANVTAAYIADRLGIKGRKDRRAEITRLRGLLESDAYQVQLVRQLDPATVDDILSAHPPGLFAVPEAHRVYPFRNLAAQLLGYTDIDLQGRPNGSGLEYTLNPWLAGKPGRELEVNAPDGQPLEKLQLATPHDGRNVQLTIDQVVQAKVQSVLEDTVRQWKAKSATAIVLDPRTGEVLAMGTAPSYDNNKAHDLSPWQLHQLTRNRAVQDMYEPGSTFKVVTFAAALSAGIIYPQMKFHLPYEIQVADRKIHDDAYRGPITLTASRILQQSSNVGTVEIARQVGPHLLSKWIAKFGFGKPTALGLYQEQAGSVLPVDDWYGSSIGNIPIGQGISVTPMQMAALYSTIANDGVLAEPHVIKQMQGRAPVKPTEKRIISTKVDHQMVNMLKGVLDPAAGGTGVRAQIPGYTVAGKTGTAQKPIPGGYSTTDYVASFVGFLPADDPQVEVMVVVDSPRGNIFGGIVAAPAFQQIGSFLTQTLSIKPDKPR